MFPGVLSFSGMNGVMTTNTLQKPPLGFTVSLNTTFWWATQTTNYPDVYPEGTLWAPLRGSTSQRVDHWETVQRVRPGDVVLHYAAPEIRGISRAATAPAAAYPPLRGYEESSDTDGVLVLTEPLFEVRIPWNLAATILPAGRVPPCEFRKLQVRLGPSTSALRKRKGQQEPGIMRYEND